jgi:hypothetical protein
MNQSEWEAQERALREERQGAAAASGDARVAAYRLIARVLRDPPLAPPPEDFAARTAARVELAARILDDRVELWLQRALLGLLVLGGAAATVVYGGEWLRAVAVRMAERADLGALTGAGWALAVAACVGLSAAVERFARRDA